MNEQPPADVRPPQVISPEEALLPALLKVAEAARLLNVGHNRIYEMAHHNCIPTIRIGKAYRFPRRQLLEWIDLQVAGENNVVN